MSLVQSAFAANLVYEGRLHDAGLPASGQFDIQVTTFDSAENGRQLAPAMTFTDITVSYGRFTLEFDVPEVDTTGAWLELAIRDSSASEVFDAFPGRVKATATRMIGQCWSSTGDSGTDPTVNFLGTTDPNPVTLRSNNVRSLELESSSVLFQGRPATANVLAGGHENTIFEGARGVTIAGGGIIFGPSADPEFPDGIPNFVSDHYGTVGGGFGNVAGNGSTTDFIDGSLTTVAGGRRNNALIRGASVGGGEENTADGVRATVGGGFRGMASSDHATVSGGFNNSASGFFSTVSGGANNCAGGAASWAGGNQAKIRPGSGPADLGVGCNGVPSSGDTNGDEGTFLWADSQGKNFQSTGPDQFKVRARGGFSANSQLIPSFADMVVGNRSNVLANTDLLLRTDASIEGYNIAMSPNPAGAELFFARYDGTFTNTLRITSVGDLIVFADAFKPGGGSWSALSDARLKSDVEPLEGALDQLMELRGVTFRYTDPDEAGRPAGIHNGLIAQEVQQAFPQWVGTDSDGNLTVGSQGFEAIVVEALRDLRTEKDVEIEALALENAQLRERLAAIEATIVRMARSSER
jgi:hypothetical protein